MQSGDSHNGHGPQLPAQSLPGDGDAEFLKDPLRQIDQAKRMKDLERENVRLKRLVADLSLEKQVLKDVASGNL